MRNMTRNICSSLLLSLVGIGAAYAAALPQPGVLALPGQPAIAAPVGANPALAKRPAGPRITTPALPGSYRPNLRASKVQLANGVQFSAQDYLRLTSLRNQKKMQNLFDPKFQQRFLKAPPVYTEEIQEADDRLVVTRKLVIQTNDPCAPGMEAAGVSLCFKLDNQPLHPESKELRRYVHVFLPT